MNWKGSSLSKGVRGILGMKITSLVKGSSETLTSKRLGMSFVKIHWVPFMPQRIFLPLYEAAPGCVLLGGKQCMLLTL